MTQNYRNFNLNIYNHFHKWGQIMHQKHQDLIKIDKAKAICVSFDKNTKTIRCAQTIKAFKALKQNVYNEKAVRKLQTKHNIFLKLKAFD